MPRIYVLSGPDVGFTCDVAGAVTFGRAEECQVRLRDGSVSRQHARLECRPDGHVEVVDLGSRNGIRIRGERRERIELRDGDEFHVGSVLVRFVAAIDAVEEIELAPAENGSAGAIADAAAATIGATAPSPVRARPIAGVGAARQRAIASKEGVLLFNRVENGAPSMLRDEMGQQSPWLRAALVVGALALAAALFYGALQLGAAVTPPAGADDESATPR